jgi:hypothetical protein
MDVGSATDLMTGASSPGFSFMSGAGAGAAVAAATGSAPAGTAAPTGLQSYANRIINQLGQKYSGDCRAAFDELSLVIQVGRVFLLLGGDKSMKVELCCRL